MGQEHSRPRSLITAGVAGAIVLLAVIVYGGYGRHWSWIGVNGHTATLWDWLHLLLLPLAALVLPLWLRHRPEVGGGTRGALAAGGAGFAVLVLAGYLVPWAWTGFAGNTLWDWLNLAALPLAVVLIPVFVELREHWGRRHALIAAGALAVFVAVVLAGYLAHWRWTGFTGNTVWDWLHLMLLPLLVPAVIVPMLTPVVTARMAGEPADGDTEPSDGSETI